MTDEYTNSYRRDERGITLYIAIMLLVIVLAMALGAGLIIFRQLRLVRDIGVSMIAFHAAEAGAEQILRIDACLLEIDENERLSCLEEASGVVDIPAVCTEPGALSPTDEKNCRRKLVNDKMAGSHLIGEAVYELKVVDPVGNADCNGNEDWGYCGTSTATFLDAQRKVEIVR